jgi:hypothetical protein
MKLPGNASKKVVTTCDAPRAPWLNKLRISQGRHRGASRSLNLIIYELCRFIPAYKAGLSRHLPVNCYAGIYLHYKNIILAANSLIGKGS